MREFRARLALMMALLAGHAALGGERVLLEGLRHLRVAGEREWSEFPERAEAERLVLRFEASASAAEQTLRLRQQDVKQTWKVRLGDREIGELPRDENDMIVYFAVPAGVLRDGENTLVVEQAGAVPDDVRVGEVRLDDRPHDEVLSAGDVLIEIRELPASTPEPIPCRITVRSVEGTALADRDDLGGRRRISVRDCTGTLQTVGAVSNDSMAVRPGVIYCNGTAKFSLPAGQYTITVGRGNEYDAVAFTYYATGRLTAIRTLTREVSTEGWVACDTHVHTLTHSGHGDATIDERMLTLAGEGIELPIATDHNVHIDYEPVARRLGMRKYFTPVIGNEVTTKVGHFNVFPVEAGAPPPDFRRTDWDGIFESIYGTPGVKVCILNHARDIHSNVRPFGPKLHNALVGENLEGWRLRANAMEVVNSAAQQTDILRLFHDWFGMLNRGVFLTPVGGSDSHDVARHFVGQGRTYIRVDDRDPGNIDVDAAVESFLAGRVTVSLGLFTEIEVNGKYGPGDVVPAESRRGEPVEVVVRVQGPNWTRAETVELFANGRKIREATIAPADAERGGLKATIRWSLDDLPRGQDVFLVAIARGPGVRSLHWPIAKPYQPKSPEWNPQVLGATGAVWIDADGNGERTAAREYAERIVNEASGDVAKAVEALKAHDEAVAAQAAYLLQARGEDLTGPEVTAALKQAAPATQRGFQESVEAWRATEIARREG